MVDIKRKQGYEVPGRYVSGYQLNYVNVWNAWDDLALYKSLYRKPNESNIVLRGRILAAKNYNSTKQGLINWLSDSFETTKYTVSDKKIYYSTYAPLSYMQYNKLKNKTQEYYAPRVIINLDNEIIFPEDKLPISGETIEVVGEYMYNAEKTVVYSSGISWTLWKGIDQSYFPIWETNEVPVDLKLRYQYLLDDELYIIEESPKGLTRDSDGNITEEE